MNTLINSRIRGNGKRTSYTTILATSIAIFATLAITSIALADHAITADDLVAHVQILASDEFEGRKKLRCGFQDMNDVQYSLPASSVTLRDTWTNQGISALNSMIREPGYAHIRIGLAHPMEDGRAFAMVNNLALY